MFLFVSSEDEGFDIGLREGMSGQVCGSKKAQAARIGHKQENRKEIFNMLLFKHSATFDHRKSRAGQGTRDLLGMGTCATEYNHIFIGIAVSSFILNISNQ